MGKFSFMDEWFLKNTCGHPFQLFGHQTDLNRMHLLPQVLRRAAQTTRGIARVDLVRPRWANMS